MGLDPGTTVGLAVLDLRGNPLYISSRKNADDFWVFQTIRSYGVPIIVATDKSTAPSRVKKIASQFGARLWVPKEDIPVSVKEETARRISCFGMRLEDDHQRDAVAAAFLAYQFFAPKFRQIEKRVGNDREKEEFVKRAVVFGQSADRAMREYEHGLENRAPKVQHTVPRRGDLSPLLKRIAELKDELRRKDELIDLLKERVAELDRELNELRSSRERSAGEDLEILRMQRDDARRRASRLAKRVKMLERIIDGIASGKYAAVNVGSAGGRIVYRTEKSVVIVPVEKKRAEEDAVERILRLVEEYRARRK
ncbi:MAG TPA: DUF460 domain-containing protein [Euryarchaeota archaeon]|nr:DUF460 domain-containing protein [Euryarchaeota archaeon]